VIGVESRLVDKTAGPSGIFCVLPSKSVSEYTCNPPVPPTARGTVKVLVNAKAIELGVPANVGMFS
jgi:hypothetical protein